MNLRRKKNHADNISPKRMKMKVLKKISHEETTDLKMKRKMRINHVGIIDHLRIKKKMKTNQAVSIAAVDEMAQIKKKKSLNQKQLKK